MRHLILINTVVCSFTLSLSTLSCASMPQEICLDSDAGNPPFLNTVKSYVQELLGQPTATGPIRTAQTPSTYLKIGANTVDCINEEGSLALLQPATLFSYAGSDIHIPFSFFQSSKSADDNGVQRVGPNHLHAPGYWGGLSISGSFMQVNGQPVYFGEWSIIDEPEDPSHMLYYSGDFSGTALPTHTATYDIYGINKYDGENLLQGHFTASLNTELPSISGLIFNEDTIIKINATISPDGLFSGDAVAYTISTQARSKGVTKGSFFAAGNHSAMAGIATFDESEHDSAFGGSVEHTAIGF